MNHLQKYLAEEFVEDYQAGRMSRRQALKKLASLTGSLMLAQSFLAACALPPEATATTQPRSTPLPASTNAGTAATGAPEASATIRPAAGTPLADTPAAGTASAGHTPAANTPGNTAAAAVTGAAAAAGTVSPGEPAVVAGAVEFPGQDGAILRGYQARPAGEGAFPVVLVCHENPGLTPHIEDVTRRFAKAGYAALAVDLLSRRGGSAAIGESQAPGALGGIAPDQLVQDFRSGWLSLQGQAFAASDRVGMVGFCFGGGVTWQVATQMAELRAAVPFYGPPPLTEAVAGIQAAVLAIYGERDQRITSTAPAIEAAMQANGKTFSKIIYPDADHAFFNDTGTRYNAAAAQDAWAQVLAWFGKYLS